MDWNSEDKSVSFDIQDFDNRFIQRIINLTAMKSKVALIFNGEIYNYLDLRMELESLGYNFRNKWRYCGIDQELYSLERKVF